MRTIFVMVATLIRALGVGEITSKCNCKLLEQSVQLNYEDYLCNGSNSYGGAMGAAEITSC